MRHGVVVHAKVHMHLHNNNVLCIICLDSAYNVLVTVSDPTTLHWNAVNMLIYIVKPVTDHAHIEDACKSSNALFFDERARFGDFLPAPLEALYSATLCYSDGPKNT